MNKIVISALIILGLSSSCTTMHQVSDKVSSIKVNSISWLQKKEKQPDIPRQSLSLADNIGMPIAHTKTVFYLRNYVLKQVKQLKQVPGLKVSTIRNGEVIRLSIESSLLFSPNATSLKNSAEALLNPILPYVAHPEGEIMLISAYTDNTGSDKYLMQLSQARANAVKSWFEQKSVISEQIVEYANGKNDPRVPNNSIENRAQNRRVDIYLIPSESMIKRAKKGKLQ